MRTLVKRVREGGTGRFASIYYDSSHDTEDAAKRSELAWREARDKVAGLGADETTLSALDRRVAAMPAPVGPACRALIAHADTVLLAEDLAQPPASPIARWSELPYLVPLLEHGLAELPHVVVRVDQVGADITAVGDDGASVARSVDGDDHIHSPGDFGWPSRTRTEEPVREKLRHNAADVAAEVTDLAKQVGAELVVVAGEVQAVSLLREQVPANVRDVMVNVPAVHDDQSRESLREQVHVLVTERRNEGIADIVERFVAERDKPDGLATDGVAGTCAALREANVATLLIGGDGESSVYAGADPIEIATEADHLADLGISPLRRRRADEALPVAALAVGARLVYTGTEAGLREGFGALLRHP